MYTYTFDLIGRKKKGEEMRNIYSKCAMLSRTF